MSKVELMMGLLTGRRIMAQVSRGVVVPDAPETAALYLYGTPSDTGNIGLRSGGTVTYYSGYVRPKAHDEVMAYPYVLSIIDGADWFRIHGYTDTPYTESHKYIIGDPFDRLRIDGGKERYTIWFDGKWTLYDEEVVTEKWSQGYAAYRLTDIAWATFDIYASDGSLYLAKSDPIPVGEIVDYDGDIPIYEVIT